MVKLIDADRLKEVFSRNVAGGNVYFDLIDNAPIVEAIPKAEYENRLKDDIIAMLTEIQLEIEELDTHDVERFYGLIENVYISEEVDNIIQQKIDKLRCKENEK